MRYRPTIRAGDEAKLITFFDSTSGKEKFTIIDDFSFEMLLFPTQIKAIKVYPDNAQPSTSSYGNNYLCSMQREVIELFILSPLLSLFSFLVPKIVRTFHETRSHVNEYTCT